jgi:Domain of unknown function (DUF3846)
MKTKSKKERFYLHITQDGVTKVKPESENSLKQLQTMVGGYIESVSLGDDLVMIVNEDGKAKNLPINNIASEMVQHGIVGDVVLCRLVKSHYVGFTADDAAANQLATIGKKATVR